jgi:hypothetical protein
MAATSYDTVIITVTISDAKLEQLKGAFPRVYYYPDGAVVPDDEAREADIWYTSWMGLPKSITKLDQVPNTKFVQLSSGEHVIQE